MTSLASELQHYREQITRVRRILERLDPDVDGEATIERYRRELGLWKQLAGELDQHLADCEIGNPQLELEEAPPLF